MKVKVKVKGGNVKGAPRGKGQAGTMPKRMC